MQPREDRHTALSKAAQTLGAAMMWAWTLTIGIFGFVLLLGVYYAMVVQSQSLLTICCFFLALPLLLTVVFGCFSVAEILVQGLVHRRGTADLVKVTLGGRVR